MNWVELTPGFLFVVIGLSLFLLAVLGTGSKKTFTLPFIKSSFATPNTRNKKIVIGIIGLLFVGIGLLLLVPHREETATLSSSTTSSTIFSNITSTPSVTYTPVPTSSTTPTGTGTSTPTPSVSSLPSNKPTPTPILTQTNTPTYTVTPTLQVILTPMADFYCTNISGLRIREGPAEFYKQISGLAFNECLNYDMRTPDGKWVRIAKGQGEKSNGWVYAEYLRPSDFEKIPTVTPEPYITFCICVRTSLRVREGPGENYDKIGSLTYSDCLKFDARVQDNAWIRIAEGQEDYEILGNGWINTLFTVPIGNQCGATLSPSILEPLQIVIPPPTPVG